MTTSIDENDSIANHGDDADYTNDQLAQMFNAGMNGDTKAAETLSTEETGAKPGAPADTGEVAKQAGVDPLAVDRPGSQPVVQADAKTPAAQDPDPANAVILAKDGKHQIPFAKLQEARDGERHWREQAQHAQQKLDELMTQAQARVDDGQAPAQQVQLIQAAQAAIESGVDPEIFGDYSEAGIASGIHELNRRSAQTLRAEVKAEVMQELRAELAPMLQQQQQSAKQTHVNAILQVHPEAHSILESAEFEDWKGKQPSYVQDALLAVLDKGSSKQVIELIDSYKAAAQPAKSSQETVQPKTPAASTQSAAQKVVDQLKAPVPNSPSDIPGGRTGAGTLAERLEGMNEVALFNALNSGEITEQQLNQFLSRKS